MKPHEETWRVVNCGNPDHGPRWECWRVKNGRDEVVLRDVNKATAERYAAFPAMARALLEHGCFIQSGGREGEWHGYGCYGPGCSTACSRDRAALMDAGVLE